MKYKVATIIVLSSLGGLSVIIAAWLKCRRKRLPEAPEWQRIGSVKELAIDVFSPVEIGLNTQVIWSANEDKLARAGFYWPLLSIKTEILRDGVVRLSKLDEMPLKLDLNAIIEADICRLPLVKCGVLAPKLKGSWWRSVECEYMPIVALHDKSIADVAQDQQFHGNFLIASEPHIAPYDEDKWRWLRVGDEVVMRYAALKNYRLREHPKEPDMGVYFNITRPGVIRLGDPVYVSYI